MCTDLWSACLLHAVGSALHKLQHALDGITDLHQSLNVLILHAGGGRGEHHSLGTYGAGELDADLMLRDGQQDVYRKGILKEFALFKPMTSTGAEALVSPVSS